MTKFAPRIDSMESYFADVILDNNGQSATDINKGLMDLFIPVIESRASEVENYLVSDIEDGYPDLVAKNSSLNSPSLWWWLLIMNGLDDSLAGIKSNWIYSINSQEQLSSINDDIINGEHSATESRLGETVELN